jgi:hypothetical protein
MLEGLNHKQRLIIHIALLPLIIKSLIFLAIPVLVGIICPIPLKGNAAMTIIVGGLYIFGILFLFHRIEQYAEKRMRDVGLIK